MPSKPRHSGELVKPASTDVPQSVDTVLARLEFRDGEWAWEPKAISLCLAKDVPKQAETAYEFVGDRWRAIEDPARLSYLFEVSKRIQLGQ